jgi:hypothetical protein
MFVFLIGAQREATVALKEKPDLLELAVEDVGVGLLVDLVQH